MMQHPYLTDWRESHLAEWKATDLSIEAPELRHESEASRPMVRTSTGLLIGASHQQPRPSHYAQAGSGPYRRRGIAARVMGALGSVGALFAVLGVLAAALLLTACGPTDNEALQDVALDLKEAQAAALLAARTSK